MLILWLCPIPQMSILLPSFHDRTRPLLTNSGHCLENCTGSHLENEDTTTLSNMVRKSSRQIQKPYFIRPYRKRKTYISAMERLFEVKNHYPLDVFNSLVIGLQEANAHLMDRRGERSLDDHD